MTKTPVWTIHGYRVVGWVETETQSTGPCGVVLVDRGEGAYQRYVTAWYRLGEGEWSSGHYFAGKEHALLDFVKRAGIT